MQDQSLITPAYDLGHYLRPLRRQRRLLVIAVVSGLVLGLAYTALSNPWYTAVARVLVGPPLTASQSAAVNPVNGRTPTAAVNLDTEAQIVRSVPVATLAQQSLKTTTSPSALLSRVGVSVPPNTTILRISCKARSARAAQACANAFAAAYLKNRATGETTAIDRQLAKVSTELASSQAQLKKDETAGVNAAKGSVRKIQSFSQVANDNQAIASLDAQRLALVQLLPADAGSITSLAGPGVAGTAGRLIPPFTGLVLGLLVGIAAAYGRERFDPYVRNRDDLLRAGVDLVAEIEASQGPAGTTRRRRDSAARTRFDQRVASIVAGSFDADGGVVYVARVSPGQGEADVARKLAATLASVGHQVEIVLLSSVRAVRADYDSEGPLLTDEPKRTAVGDDLLGWPTPAEGSEHATALDLTTPTAGVLTPVEAPTDSVPLNLRLQLEMARQRAQFVIIDGDPAVTDAQAYVLAALSDTTLLVIDPDATTRRDLDEVVDQLSVTSSHLLGAVIWRPTQARRPSPQTAPHRPRAVTPEANVTEPHGNVRPVEPDESESPTPPGASSKRPRSTRPSRPVDAPR